MTLGLTQIVHIALACGYLTAFTGYPGFAKADSVDELKSSVKDIRVAQIDGKLLDDRKRQCGLPRANADAREFLEARINWELEQYRRLSGQDYRLPDCGEF